MTQVTPSITSGLRGSEFRTLLNQVLEAIVTQHSGSTRPSYAAAKMIWLDTSANPWVLNLFDGTEDIPIGTFNTTTNKFSPSNALLATGAAMTGLLELAKGSAIASAATTDVGAATANLVHITGTTTITSLGTAPQAGAERTLVFDGALTLTHDAGALVLPGGANITTSVGDVAYFVADTTSKWVCKSYMHADAANAFLSFAQAWTKPQRIQATYTSAATSGSVTLDMGTYSDFELTLTGNISALNNPTITAAMVGQKGSIIFTQDGTGSRTLTGLGSVFKRVGATGAPTLPTAAGAIGRMDYHIRTTGRIEYTYGDVEA